jgi:hypothetical protein
MNERAQCIFCKSYDLTLLFANDFIIPQSMCMTETPETGEWMPYNVQKCRACNCFQNKYLADLNLLYSRSHINPIGTIRNKMTIELAELIGNSKTKNIIEIGAGNGMLSELILEIDPSISYTIVDPSYTGNTLNRTLVYTYIENHHNWGDADTLIMSHTFEHFYDPQIILEQIQKHSNILNVIVCHPHFDKYITQDPMTYNCLNCEHTFFITNEHLVTVFEKYGLRLVNFCNHDDYSITFHFSKLLQPKQCIISPSIDINTYFKDIFSRIEYLNSILISSEDPVYIWPCSVHIIMLFYLGLQYKKLAGVLDNSPHKHNQFIYGYQLKCYSFCDIVNQSSKNITIIFNGGCFNKEVAQQIYPPNIKIIF